MEAPWIIHRCLASRNSGISPAFLLANGILGSTKMGRWFQKAIRRHPSKFTSLINAVTGEVRFFQNHLYDYRPLAEVCHGELLLKRFGYEIDSILEIDRIRICLGTSRCMLIMKYQKKTILMVRD